MNQARIPKLTTATAAGAKSWFTRMHSRGLMFHPDDDPAEIIQISDGTRTFSNAECVQVSGCLDQLFAALGNAVYDIAFDVASTTFHTRAERGVIAAACG